MMIRKKSKSVKYIGLAINTATFHESVALFLKGRLIAEKTWRGNSDESEKLLPAIFSLFKKTRHVFADLDRIVVAKGPGPFSAVRIGTTVANTLAFTLGIPIFSIDSKTLWKLRVPAKDAILFLHAGGNFVFRSGANLREGVFPIEEGLNQSASSKIFYGNLTQKELETFEKLKEKSWKFIPEDRLKTFGEAAIGVESNMFKREKIVTPLYWKPPNITRPKT